MDSSSLIQGNDLVQARKTIVYIVNSLSPSSRLKGVHIDDIVSYGESLGIYPESIIGVVQQLAKEGLLVEASRNRFLNKFPPISIPKDRETTTAVTTQLSSDALGDNQGDAEEMERLLEGSHLLVSPLQLQQVKREYYAIMSSGNSNFFYEGYPSDAEIGKKVGIDKRKVQGARVLLGLLSERDVKITFNRDKFLSWLVQSKDERKSSKEFAEELGVSYSTFKRKRALWEAYLSKSRSVDRSMKH
ncbi:MAG: hypothetical protein ACXV44_06815 [Halobacteriota archaeon]